MYATIRSDGQYVATFQHDDGSTAAFAIAVRRADPFQTAFTLTLPEAASRIARIQEALTPAPVKARKLFTGVLSALRRDRHEAINTWAREGAR